MSNYLTLERRAELLAEYRDSLMGDVLPFWLKNGLDREYGGILTGLGRTGEVIDTDKSVWFQGRAGWMFATMFNTVPRPEYLEAAVSCCEFLRTKCYAPGGKLYFSVTRDGKPLRMRRYAYSESFAAIGFAATHKATGNPKYRELAIQALETYLHYSFTPGAMAAKTEPTRAMRTCGPLMIGIATAQEMRQSLGDIEVAGKTLSEHIANMIAEYEKYFVKSALKVVMESVGENGEISDHFEGRLLNPGHAIEAAWFILHESKRTGNVDWKQLGLNILDWMWDRGWDAKHGGLLYFVDVYDKPIQEYWHFMKFWWPHNEAVIATLLAYTMTGDDKYAEMHRQVHDWAYTHFPDREHGEWYGYLDRTGNPTTELKGNMWKGPFHMPRMKWYCWQLLEA